MSLIIAILAQVDDDKNTKLAAAYTEAIEKSGGVPLIFPYTEDEETVDRLTELCDGFLFSGGADIEPSLYGEQRSPHCGESQGYRDSLELRVFAKVFEAGKPIMGICRGAQLINVALGGTLYQDIPTELDTKIPHSQSEGKNMPSHSVVIKHGTPLYGIVGKSQMPANSFHHQALKHLGKGLSVMAESIDGVIEAVYHTGARYLRAYQWHPERLYESSTENKVLFDDFLNAVRKTK